LDTIKSRIEKLEKHNVSGTTNDKLAVPPEKWKVPLDGTA